MIRLPPILREAGRPRPSADERTSPTRATGAGPAPPPGNTPPRPAGKRIEAASFHAQRRRISRREQPDDVERRVLQGALARTGLHSRSRYCAPRNNRAGAPRPAITSLQSARRQRTIAATPSAGRNAIRKLGLMATDRTTRQRAPHHRRGRGAASRQRAGAKCEHHEHHRLGQQRGRVVPLVRREIPDQPGIARERSRHEHGLRRQQEDRQQNRQYNAGRHGRRRAHDPPCQDQACGHDSAHRDDHGRTGPVVPGST